ncbi:MAG: hypothetical protein KGR68_03780 [Betaproteobacteria bacterium]|nr:hypothetical protein [Betaproteobacteria bacterium]
MAAYQLMAGGGVLRAADGVAIPADSRNADWRDYLAWIAAGNTADPAATITIPKRLDAVLESLPLARKKALLVAAGASGTLLD